MVYVTKSRFITLMLVFSLLIGIQTPVSAEKKASLKNKKISIKVGQKKTIKIKNKKKKAKYIFRSSKGAVASVSKTGVVCAKKAGKAKIKVTEQYKKVKRTLGTVTINVQPKSEITVPTPVPDTSSSPVPATASPAISQAPSSSPDMTPDVSEPTQTPVASSEPTQEPDPTLKPMDTNYDTPAGFDKKDTSLTTYGTLKEIKYDSTTTGTKRRANIILPADYSTDKEYPVLYLLHGIGGNHNEWKDGKPVFVIGNLIAEGKAKDMIVVMPNVRARANDDGNPSDIYSPEHFAAFDNFINDLRDDLMPYLKENYSIAEGRMNTAIAGLSMGGREALYIGLSMPETFGYIGAFEPAPGVLPYASEAGLFTEETLKLPDEYNNRTFIMIVKGNQDGTVGDNPLNYHNALTKNGTVHTYYTMDGGHDFTVWKNGLYNFARRIF